MEIILLLITVKVCTSTTPVSSAGIPRTGQLSSQSATLSKKPHLKDVVEYEQGRPSSSHAPVHTPESTGGRETKRDKDRDRLRSVGKASLSKCTLAISKGTFSCYSWV